MKESRKNQGGGRSLFGEEKEFYLCHHLCERRRSPRPLQIYCLNRGFRLWFKRVKDIEEMKGKPSLLQKKERVLLAQVSTLEKLFYHLAGGASRC